LQHLADHTCPSRAQALASLKVGLLGTAAAVMLAALTHHRFPALVTLPAIVINMTFLQISRLHGLIFSLIQIPWMYLCFLPIQWILALPLAYALLFMYTPIPIILLRRKPDRHGPVGRCVVPWARWESCLPPPCSCPS
jgi:hypothetical protein